MNVAVGNGVNVGEDVTGWVADEVGAGDNVIVKTGDGASVEVAEGECVPDGGTVADGSIVAVGSGLDKPQAMEIRANVVKKRSRLDLVGLYMVGYYRRTWTREIITAVL